MSVPSAAPSVVGRPGRLRLEYVRVVRRRPVPRLDAPRVAVVLRVVVVFLVEARFLVTITPSSQAGDPVLEKVQTRVAGLLGVELRGAERTVLHGGDESRPVLGPGDDRRL